MFFQTLCFLRENFFSTEGGVLQLRGIWQDRNERKHILRLYRPRVSNFLSHRIVIFFCNSGFPTFLESPFIIKWSLDLQLGPQIFPKSQGLLVEGAFGENLFWKMTTLFILRNGKNIKHRHFPKICFWRSCFKMDFRRRLLQPEAPGF